MRLRMHAIVVATVLLACGGRLVMGQHGQVAITTPAFAARGQLPTGTTQRNGCWTRGRPSRMGPTSVWDLRDSLFPGLSGSGQ